MIVSGAIAGIALAAFSSRLIAAFLFGVDPLDPLTFVGVPVVILPPRSPRPPLPPGAPAASIRSSRSATTDRPFHHL